MSSKFLTKYTFAGKAARLGEPWEGRPAGAGMDAPCGLAAGSAGPQKGRGHAEMVRPPLKAGAAVYSVVDSLERTETFSAVFFFTPNRARDKINKLVFAASRCSLRDSQVQNDGQSSEAQHSPQLTRPGSWDSTSGLL